VSERWRILAGSVAGGAHARAGVGGQDAFAVEQIGGTLLVVVADGAGSMALAGVGAPLAVAIARRRLGARWRAGPGDLAGDDEDTAAAWHAYLGSTGDAVLRQFRRAATALARTRHSGRADDLGTTLTAVVAHPPWLAVFAVGDGFVVTRATDGHLDLLLAPPGGVDRPPGGTALLTSPGARAAARRIVTRIPDLTGVAVGTDGLDKLVLEHEHAVALRAHTKAFDRLFDLAADPGTDAMHLTRLLADQQVSRLTDDDRTLVLAVPR
jgi:hypothetical protein